MLKIIHTSRCVYVGMRFIKRGHTYFYAEVGSTVPIQPNYAISDSLLPLKSRVHPVNFRGRHVNGPRSRN